MKTALLWLLCVSATGFAAPTRAVDSLKELMINNPLVTQDRNRIMPGKAWHFGQLVREMLPADATPKQVTDFVIGWLSQWETVTEINGFNVDLRPSVRTNLICPWLNASSGTTDCTGDLNLDIAPFRLIAIVNHIDLRKPGSAGEARFAFAALSAPTSDPLSTSVFPQSWTFLVSYKMPVTTRKTLKEWADQWHALGSKACTTADDCEPFRVALNNLTNDFSRRGTLPGRANGNALLTIRSNEIAIGFPWQLREFRYEETTEGQISMISSTVNKTPDMSLNNSQQLADFVLENQAAILAETHVVPKPMLGGKADMDGVKWAVPGVSEELRFKFAKNTCNGCHSTEAPAVQPISGFYHISPQGQLSPFTINLDLPKRKADFEKLLKDLEGLREVL